MVQDSAGRLDEREAQQVEAGPKLVGDGVRARQRGCSKRRRLVPIGGGRDRSRTTRMRGALLRPTSTKRIPSVALHQRDKRSPGLMIDLLRSVQSSKLWAWSWFPARRPAPHWWRRTAMARVVNIES